MHEELPQVRTIALPSRKPLPLTCSEQAGGTGPLAARDIAGDIVSMQRSKRARAVGADVFNAHNQHMHAHA